jgi:hypothetical protein
MVFADREYSYMDYKKEMGNLEEKERGYDNGKKVACLLIEVPPRGRSRLIPSLGKVSSDELQMAPSQDY